MKEKHIKKRSIIDKLFIAVIVFSLLGLVLFFCTKQYISLISFFKSIVEGGDEGPLLFGFLVVAVIWGLGQFMVEIILFIKNGGTFK